jgi:hypothetical protein
MISRLGAIALAAVLFAAPLSAQDTTGASDRRFPAPGARVRVRTIDASQWHYGTLAGVSRDSIRFEPEREEFEVALPLDAIDRIELSTGRQRHVWKSAAIGAAVGAGIGIVGGLASGDDDPYQFMAFTAQEKAMLLGSILGAVGFAGGVIVGVVAPHEHWRPIVRPAGGVGRVTPARARRGVSLGLQLRIG